MRRRVRGRLLLRAATAVAAVAAAEEVVKTWMREEETQCSTGGTDLEDPPGAAFGGGQIVEIGACKVLCEANNMCEGITMKLDAPGSKQGSCFRLGDIKLDSCQTQQPEFVTYLIVESGGKWWDRMHADKVAQDAVNADATGATATDKKEEKAEGKVPALPVTLPSQEWKVPKWMEHFQPYGDCNGTVCFLSVLKGSHGVIDFTKWKFWKNADEFSVIPTKAPIRGNLLDSHGKAWFPDESPRDPRNIYLYVPWVEDWFEDMAQDPEWEDSEWGKDLEMGNLNWTHDFIYDYDDYQAKPLFKAKREFDTVQFVAHWFDDADAVEVRRADPGKIIIHLIDAPPQTDTVVFRMVNGKDRIVTLRATDMNIDHSNPLGLTTEEEIKELWVKPPLMMEPTSPGKIYRFDESGAEIEVLTAVNLGGDPKNWRIKYVASDEMKKKAEDSSMNAAYELGSSHNIVMGQEMGHFQYWAIDNDKQHSVPGTVKMVYDRNHAPKAYNFNYSFHILGEEYHVTELMANDANGDRLTFFVKTLPKYGKVFMRSKENFKMPSGPALGMPGGLEMGPHGYEVGKGSTRAVLLYEPPPAETYNGSRIFDTLTFIAQDENYESSNVATVQFNIGQNRPPACGDRSYNAIFTNQENVTVNLNYEDPDRDRIAKLIMVRTPKEPLGDLVLRERISVGQEAVDQLDVAEVRNKYVVLKAGDAFTDKDGLLQYVLRPSTRGEKRTGEDIFLFRAVDEYGGQCMAQLDEKGRLISQLGRAIFRVSKHDQEPTPELEAEGVRAIRAERVGINQWHLLPLWGKANKTLPSAPESATLIEFPKKGHLYALNDRAVWDPTLPYTGYCYRWNCEKYKGYELKSGGESAVKAVTLQGRPGHPEHPALRPDLWVLYKTVKEPACIGSPAPQPCQAQEGDMDTFRFMLEAGGQKSEVEQTSIFVAPAKLRQVVITYQPGEHMHGKHHDPGSIKDEQLIVCQLHNQTDTSQVQVRILEAEEDLRLHHEIRPFFMFQYATKGYEPLKGARLDSMSGKTTRHGISAMWVTSNNTLIVVPRANVNQKSFKFRAAIWKKQADGYTWVETEVVQFVVRRLNSPAVARSPGEPFNALIGRRTTITLTGHDPDNDYLTFIISKLPQYGLLQRDARKMRRSRMGLLFTLREGAKVAVPPRSADRNRVEVFYTPKRSIAQAFPIDDYFEFQVDDGSGILSAPQRVEVTITGSALKKYKRESRLVLSIMFVAAVTIFTVSIVVFLCRRYISCCRPAASPRAGGGDGRGRHARLPGGGAASHAPDKVPLPASPNV